MKEQGTVQVICDLHLNLDLKKNKQKKEEYKLHLMNFELLENFHLTK